MRVRKPELVEHGQEVRIRALVEWEGRREYLWYAVERRYGEYLTPEHLDAFVVGLLMPAMMAGEDLHVDGPVSEKLHWNLRQYYMRILRSVNPKLSAVRVLAAELYDGRQRPRPTGVGAGFSGGIDSFCVLADHFLDDVPQAYRITHLLFNNVGSHGDGGCTMFRNRAERLRPCAEELGLPFICIDSNLDEFYRLGFQESHSVRNISAALVLQKLLGKCLYASAFRYEDCFVGRTKFAGHTDPVAIHLLSTERMECILSGAQYSRVEKTARITKIPQSYRYLDVCIDPRRGNVNCGVCWKCARTLLTLELLGKTSLYEAVFPLEKYRLARRRCVARVLSKNSPLTREVALLARERSCRFPWDIKALVTIRRASAYVRSLLLWRHVLP
ncbi:MAG: hypothetical protein RBR19_09130 [Sedimentisphaerales bacterium]|jgi:hypothetical protein|nr:hypothetical protein [Sedimentisphaerales bacterium]NLT75093.1 hypothetical protein [Planctomycetota bacterium]